MKNQREIKNLLLVPESQIRYGLLFLSISSILHIVATVIALNLYTYWTTEDVAAAPFPAWILLVGVLLIFGVLNGFAFVLALMISHRLFGPLVPLTRMVEDLKKGNYSARIQLRDRDDAKMKEFAKSLNELAASLEKNA